MTFNFEDKTRITLKWYEETNHVASRSGAEVTKGRYPIYTILDNADKENHNADKNDRNAYVRCPLGEEGCPYLKYKARSCIVRAFTKSENVPDCETCHKGRMEKMFKLSSTLKKAKENKKSTYFRGTPDGKKTAWGGPLTKDDQAADFPRSPFDPNVREGHLYFSGNATDIQRLLARLSLVSDEFCSSRMS